MNHGPANRRNLHVARHGNLPADGDRGCDWVVGERGDLKMAKYEIEKTPEELLYDGLKEALAPESDRGTFGDIEERELNALRSGANFVRQPLLDQIAELKTIAIDLRYGYRELFNSCQTTTTQDAEYFSLADRADKVLNLVADQVET